MSEEAVETVPGVRTPVTVSVETTGRTLDERIFIRFPALVRVFGFAWTRLPPRSRLRRAIISRLSRLGCEAVNRRDFDLLLLFLDPEFEMRFDESPIGGFVPPDLVGVHRGHEAFLRIWETAIEAINLRIEHEEVIDFGEQFLAIGRQTGHGRASGIQVDEPLFQLFTLRHGLVIREEDFVDREKALEAAGLSE
jgi:ketosteroid isomerase-like protein